MDVDGGSDKIAVPLSLLPQEVHGSPGMGLCIKGNALKTDKYGKKNQSVAAGGPITEITAYDSVRHQRAGAAGKRTHRRV